MQDVDKEERNEMCRQLRLKFDIPMMDCLMIWHRAEGNWEVMCELGAQYYSPEEVRHRRGHRI